jgi:hypothetical protein
MHSLAVTSALTFSRECFYKSCLTKKSFIVHVPEITGIVTAKASVQTNIQVAHYYLMTLFAVSFTLHAITRPVFYTPFVLVAVTAIGMRIAVAVRSSKERMLGASTG